MKTKLFLGVAVAIALNCSAVSADVLGGNLAGGLGGSLGGGIGGVRDVSAMGHGSGQGAFGADLDTSSLRRSTRDLAKRTTGRADSTLNTATDRSRSTFQPARRASEGALAAANDQAVHAADSTSASAAWGANVATHASHDAFASATTAQAAATGAASATSQLPSTDLNIPRVPDALASQNEAAIDGSLAKSVSAGVAEESAQAPLTTTGDATGSGQESASRDGVSARGSAKGSASASIEK